MTYDLTSLDPRTYQRDAHEWASERDGAVVCLPTGTGKTLIGCKWACDLLEEHGIERILVLEPSRFLVEQVASYYAEQTTIPTESLYGTTPPSERPSKWANGTAVVTTPQTALNDRRFLTDFDAVVVDECHHTTGQHAFAKLMRSVDFQRKLGLSATIPHSKEREVESLVGEIRRWSWDHPQVSEFVPEWIGEVYDTPYPDAYREVVDRLEAFRLEFDGSRLAGLPTLGIRMLARDGGLALEETLQRSTTMGDLMGEELLPMLGRGECPSLHKLDACERVLDDHEFETALIFVDRVAVAERLADHLERYDPVLLLGRLHSSRGDQERAVQNAADSDLIIATAAGEEGIDLPSADLLVVWSNVVSSVRFVQRLGRIMRKQEGIDRPKRAVYLATPDSPDYEALRQGLQAASAEGLDIVGIDSGEVFAGSVVARVAGALGSTPQQLSELAETLGQPESKVERWLRKNVRSGDVFYLYAVPSDLSDWRKSKRGIAEAFGLDTDLDDDSGDGGNVFSPSTENRYYCREDDLSLLEAEFRHLLDGSGDNHLKVDVGPTNEDRNLFSIRGTRDSVGEDMVEKLTDADRFYANISRSSRHPTYSFQMTYQGSTSEEILRAVVGNADAIATTLEDRLSSS